MKNVIAALDMKIREIERESSRRLKMALLFTAGIFRRGGRVGQSDMGYEPPRPLNVKIYRCDHDYITSR
jgi:peptide subunit release factor 1 (eRF1)